jgi:hypothetical protein
VAKRFGGSASVVMNGRIRFAIGLLYIVVDENIIVLVDALIVLAVAPV